MFGDQFQWLGLDIIIGTIRCLTSTFSLMKIKFLEEMRKALKFQIVATWKVGKFGLFGKFKQMYHSKIRH